MTSSIKREEAIATVLGEEMEYIVELVLKNRMAKLEDYLRTVYGLDSMTEEDIKERFSACFPGEEL